jgi:hypothetical protein
MFPVRDVMAQRIYGVLLINCLLLLVVVFSFIPWVGLPVAFFGSCLLYSFTATQYGSFYALLLLFGRSLPC